ncbi:MAG: hypothetical protein ACRD1I_08245, partial [Terriglobia bacterium]
MNNPSTRRERRLQILAADLAELQRRAALERIQAAIEDAKHRAAKFGSSPKSVIAVYCIHFHRVTRWGRKRSEPLASLRSPAGYRDGPPLRWVAERQQQDRHKGRAAKNAAEIGSPQLIAAKS